MKVSLTFLSIPSIIPRRRLVSSMLVMVISSTIFIGSLSVIYDINTVSKDFLGEEDNVFVIYNPEASTPFTSVIPQILENSIKEIPGVTKTSPEILLPVNALGQPIYVRAGYLPKLMAFDEGSELKAEMDTISLIGNYAIIGSSLASRLNIKLGDTFSIYSIIRKVDVSVTIVGILSNSLYNDEILISLSVGRYLSTANSYQVGHIRVGFDPTITSQEEITRIALRDNKIKLNFLHANDSSTFGDLQLVILENGTNSKIVSTPLRESHEFFLSTNYYKIEVQTINGIVVPTNFSGLIYLDRDVELTIQMRNYVYNKTLKLVNNNNPIPNISYELTTMFGKSIARGNLNSNGEVSHLLNEEEYKVEFYYLQREYSFTFYVRNSSPQVFDLGLGIAPLRDMDLRNSSILITNSFQLNFGPVNYPFKVLVDNNLIYSKSGSEQNYKLDFTLPDGKHKLYIVNEITKKNIITWSFVIDQSYDPIKQNYLFDNVVLNTQEIYSLNISAFKPATVSVMANEEVLDVIEDYNNLLFQLPSTLGFYILKIQGTLFSGEGYQEEFKVIVSNSSKKIGWLAPHESIPVKKGESYQIWSRGEITDIAPGWELTRQTQNYYNIKRTGDSPLWMLTQNENISLPFVAVSRDSEYINSTLGNGTETTLLSLNNTSVNTDEIAITFDPLLYDVYWGTSRLESGWTYDFLYNVSVTFEVRNKITGKEESIAFTIEGADISDGTLILGEGFPSSLEGNKLNLWSEQSSFNFTVSWVNGTVFYQGSLLQNERQEVLLPYGIFKVNATSLENVATVAWMMNVTYNGDIQRTTINSELSYLKGYIKVNSTTEIELFRDGTTFYGDKTITNNYRGASASLVSPTIYSSSTFKVKVKNAVFVLLEIQYTNGTKFSEMVLTDSGYYSAGSDSNVTLRLRGIDTANQSFFISKVILLNQPLLNYTFIFENRTRSPITDLTFTVIQKSGELIETGNVTSEFFSATIPLFDTSFELEVLDSAGVAVPFTFVTDEKEKTVNVYVNNPVITFTYYNPNFNTTGQYNGLLLYRPVGLITWQLHDLQENPYLEIPAGLYEFKLLVDELIAYEKTYIGFSTRLNISFPIAYKNFTVIFYEFPADTSVKLEVRHEFLNESILVEKVSSNPNTWVLRNAPIGPYTFDFKGEVVQYRTEQILSNSATVRIEFIDRVAKGRENFGNSFNRPQVAGGYYGVAKNSEYLNTYIKGTLSIINLILATEVILVFIISLVNISIFLSSVTEESIRELRIVQSLGFPDLWVMYAFGKWLAILALISALIGQIFASVLIQMFISSNSLVIFGHLFRPNVNQPIIIIGNIIFVLSVSFISAYYSYRKKIRK